jgi:hypothetical protein
MCIAHPLIILLRMGGEAVAEDGDVDGLVDVILLANHGTLRLYLHGSLEVMVIPEVFLLSLIRPFLRLVDKAVDLNLPGYLGLLRIFLTITMLQQT